MAKKSRPTKQESKPRFSRSYRNELLAENTKLRGENMKLQGENYRASEHAAENLRRAVTAELQVQRMTGRLTKMVNTKETVVKNLNAQINGLLWVLNEEDAEPHDVGET